MIVETRPASITTKLLKIEEKEVEMGEEIDEKWCIPKEKIPFAQVSRSPLVLPEPALFLKKFAKNIQGTKHSMYHIIQGVLARFSDSANSYAKAVEHDEKFIMELLEMSDRKLKEKRKPFQKAYPLRKYILIKNTIFRVKEELQYGCIEHAVEALE